MEAVKSVLSTSRETPPATIATGPFQGWCERSTILTVAARSAPGHAFSTTAILSRSSLFFLLTSETHPAFPSSLAHPDYFNSLIADLGVGVES